MRCESTRSAARARSIESGSEGFTLLEVLIAFALLLFITLFTYQKIGATYQLRDRLQTQGDFSNSVTMAMGVIDRDITMLYSPVMMIMPKDTSGQGQNQAQAQAGAVSAEEQEAIAWGDQKRGSEFWHGVVDVTGIRAMHFQGEAARLSFVSGSHVRVYKEARESVFAKVTYELRDDEFATEDLEGTRVLVKLENPNAFDPEADDTDQLRTYRLLQGIRSIKFQYFEKERNRWLNNWDSEQAEFKYKYPDLIKMEVEVAGEGRLTHEGTYFFRPEVPIHGHYPTF